MRPSKGRVVLLYVVAAIALAACVHAFITEGVGVSSVVSALLALVLGSEATRQLRSEPGRQGEEDS